MPQCYRPLAGQNGNIIRKQVGQLILPRADFRAPATRRETSRTGGDQGSEGSCEEGEERVGVTSRRRRHITQIRYWNTLRLETRRWEMQWVRYSLWHFASWYDNDLIMIYTTLNIVYSMQSSRILVYSPEFTRGLRASRSLLTLKITLAKLLRSLLKLDSCFPVRETIRLPHLLSRMIVCCSIDLCLIVLWPIDNRNHYWSSLRRDINDCGGRSQICRFAKPRSFSQSGIRSTGSFRAGRRGRKYVGRILNDRDKRTDRSRDKGSSG